MTKFSFSLLASLAAVVLIGQGCIFSSPPETTTDADPETMTDDTSPATDDAMMEDKDEDAMMEDKTNDPEDEAMMDKDEDVMSSGGTYEAYSPAKLALADSGDVVLFFRASWCPTCKALDANIQANQDDIPDDLTILDVDYDNSTELKQKYGVTYQHTLVQVDSEGNLIKKWSGGNSLATITAQVE